MKRNKKKNSGIIAKSAGTVEYANCIFAEE